MSPLGANVDFTLVHQLQGGSSHEVWKVRAENTVLALKILNPLILAKPNAKMKIIHAEQFAWYCQQHGIPAVCALEVAGTLLHPYVDGRLTLRYPFIAGATQYYPEFSVAEVAKIAGLLARIHRLPPFLGKEACFGKVYSHRDLDPKNVMWQAGEPYIIDWESAGLIDPMEELVALAFEWSGFERGEVEQHYFQSFFSAYAKAGGNIIKENLDAGLQGFIRNYQAWLQFNQYRLAADCSIAEKKLAQAEISKTERKLAFLESKTAQVFIR